MSVAWPALRSFFGEIVTTEACIIILDNILCSRPVFLEYLVVAYALRKNRRIDHLNVQTLIKHARSLFDRHFEDNPNKAPFTPLGRGFYPVIPIIKKTHNWKQKELERIREEAEIAKTQRTLTVDIDEQEEKLTRQRHRWMWKREDLKQVEEDQIREVQRREKELLLRESGNEQKFLERSRIEVQNRRGQEEQAVQ